MNAKYLLFTLLMLIVVGWAIQSTSTLTPERGVNHVFYGSYNDFMAQEVTSGDFNGDGKEDAVTSLQWDLEGGCNATEQNISQNTACVVSDPPYTRWVAVKGAQTKYICGFADPDLAEAQRAYWVDECGWDIVDTLSCDACVQALWFSENEGALHVEMGGDWSGKPRDIDLTTSGSDHMVVGNLKGDQIYNGMASGNVNGDSYDDLIAGASQRGNGGPGEVYVIDGASSWPDTIRPPSDGLVSHYFKGRDANDQFGLGIVAGDLNDDGKADVVVAAPYGDGPGNGRTDGGEIYIFYSVGTLPTTKDMSVFSDTLLGQSNYVQVIWGAHAHDRTGVTEVDERHEHDGRQGNYEPTSLAIGDWNGDGFNDLAIGAGDHGASQITPHLGNDGVAYIIFGASTSTGSRKLRPGKTLDLHNSVGSTTGPDVRIAGKSRSLLGAGLAFVDADGEGPSGKDDLIIGAPYAELDGDTLNWDYKGEAYIIWGDTKTNLTSNADRYSGDSGDVDVTITGQDGGDQIGGHISGNRDVDNDSKNDFGIAGQYAAYLFFGHSQGSWESTIDLATVIDDEPDTRILKWMNVDPEANSMTIRLAYIGADGNADLVFGGYDLPGIEGQEFPDQIHAGQMWVMDGSAMWKSGNVSTDQTWSGNVFVDGDVNVTSNKTLTISAGTTVWAWPHDALKNGLGVDTTRIEIKVTSGSLVVDGTEDNPVIFQAWDAIDPTTDTDDKWYGIWIDDDCYASINHAIIRNAYRGIQTRSSMELKNSIVENCKIVGVTIAGDSTDADSLYMLNTTVRNVPGSEGLGGIGINILGKKAAALVSGCTVTHCPIGVAVYSKGKLWGDMTVSHASSQAIQVSSRGWAQIGGYYASDAIGLKLVDGGHVDALAATLFKGGDFGVKIEKDGANLPSAYFDRCLIDSSGVGAQVAETDDVEFDHCDVNYNEDDGIYCLSDADVVIDACYVQHNGATGIRCDDSGPTITDNDIEHNAGGVTCQDFANPLLRRNKIWNNTNGLGFVDDATADLTGCGGECPPCDDGNSFKTNSGYHVTNLTEDDIHAECNYWGRTTPLSSKFYGSVYYDPWLSDDPAMVYVAGPPASQTLDTGLPKVYRLAGNIPNPFNPITTIRYDVPPPGGHVKMRIYNVQGQLVKVLVDDATPAGFHQVVWNGVDQRGTGVATGVYFVEMLAPRFRATHKILMLK